MPRTESHPPQHRASLFRNGRNQAVRIPREFELSAEEVIISKDGDKLIMEPVASRGRLLSVLAQLEPWGEEFPDWDEGQRPLDEPEV